MSIVLHYYALGGVSVLVLLLFSIVALSITLYKVWQFWLHYKLHSKVGEEAAQLLSDKQLNAARNKLKDASQPSAQLLEHILKVQADTRLSVEQINVEVQRKARNLLASCNSLLRPLEVIASLAPLIGLFGTVLGMIEAFQAMQSAGSDVNPGILAAGIWKALLTTAVGLAVAIPVALIHSFFESVVNNQLQVLQNLIDSFCNECQQQRERSISRLHQAGVNSTQPAMTEREEDASATRVKQKAV